MAGIKEIREFILDALFPRICCSCRKNLEDENFLCNSCRNEIKINTSLYCPLCQNRLPDGTSACHKQTKYILGSVANYDAAPLQELIKLLKYKRLEKIGEVLGAYLNEYVESTGLDLKNFIIMPIPLAPKRLRERGFNQAEVIAKSFLAQNKKSLAFMPDNLKRIKNTPPQVNTKSYEERKRNMTDAFQLKNPELVNKNNIALIDDVHTSGNTMREAAEILKKAGAKKIVALTILRA